LAAATAVTNAEFFAIPLYRCGVLHDPFCWFSRDHSAGFLTIRDKAFGSHRRPQHLDAIQSRFGLDLGQLAGDL
jgi:hypothetical protein